MPNLITQRITPWQQANRTRYDAFYVQDQWTATGSRCRARCVTSMRGASSPRA